MAVEKNRNEKLLTEMPAAITGNSKMLACYRANGELFRTAPSSIIPTGHLSFSGETCTSRWVGPVTSLPDTSAAGGARPQILTETRRRDCSKETVIIFYRTPAAWLGIWVI